MSGHDELKDRLARLIIEKGALKFGDFTLASGKKSDYYIDGRIIGLMPEGSYLIGEIIYGIITGKYPEATAVGGLIAGAVPVAAAVARASYGKEKQIDAFMIRKEAKGHGTKKAVEGPLEPGRTVVVVDDVITTGGSTIEAMEKIEEFGCRVAGAICVVDRQDEKLEKLAACDFTAVLTISELREYNARMKKEKVTE